MSAPARAITPSAWRRSSGRRAGCWPRTSCRDVRDALSERVQRERLDNVAVKLGTPDNPMLPGAARSTASSWSTCITRCESPYAFLWHLRDGVKPDGLVIVVDADRPVKQHGMPPAQLKCEFAALGMQPVKFSMLTGGDAYLMAFRARRAAARAGRRSSACG